MPLHSRLRPQLHWQAKAVAADLAGLTTANLTLAKTLSENLLASLERTVAQGGERVLLDLATSPQETSTRLIRLRPAQAFTPAPPLRG